MSFIFFSFSRWRVCVEPRCRVSALFKIVFHCTSEQVAETVLQRVVGPNEVPKVWTIFFLFFFLFITWPSQVASASRNDAYAFGTANVFRKGLEFFAEASLFSFLCLLLTRSPWLSRDFDSAVCPTTNSDICRMKRYRTSWARPLTR